MDYFYKIQSKYSSKPAPSVATSQPTQVISKSVIHEEVTNQTSEDIDEAMEFERLKAERRKRKNKNATNEG